MQNNFHLFIVRHISDKVNKNKSVYTQYERKSFYEKNSKIFPNIKIDYNYKDTTNNVIKGTKYYWFQNLIKKE